MSRTVLLIGSLDTKGDEYAFVRDLIVARGHKVLLLDVGILKDPPFAVDLSAARVAEAGGSALSALRSAQDRGAAIDVMTKGASALICELFSARTFDGVLGLGGGGGTTVATAAMRMLPVGVPKLMVSTMASGNTAPYVDVKDITMMYSVVDIAGLNPLSRRILSNAAGAICGMVEQEIPAERGSRPMIAASMFGVTTPCVTEARKRLEAAGYDVLVFHATGSGGRAMEGLIDERLLCGRARRQRRPNGPTKWLAACCQRARTGLNAAGSKGVPQVVSVGALDMVNFGAFDTVPAAVRGAQLLQAQRDGDADAHDGRGVSGRSASGSPRSSIRRRARLR